jgi:hypothetical protein
MVTLPLYLPPLSKGGRISYLREASPLFTLLYAIDLQRRGVALPLFSEEE